MFLNIQELVQEIEDGKSTDDIVEERLSYLNSEDYKSKMHRSDRADFIQGYISDDEKMSGTFGDGTYYWMDEKQIFKDVIEAIVRKNLSTIKQHNGMPLQNLMQGIRHYFLRAQPNEESFVVYQQMIREGKSKANIREEFGERLIKHLLEKKDNDNREKLNSQIEERENYGNIVPIPISSIKGLNIGECTEMALLSQNLLSFFGYNTFMVEGKTYNSENKKEFHNFNFIEKDGKYFAFDSAMCFFGLAPEIKTPEELLLFDEMTLNNNQKSITYFSSRKSKIYNEPEKKLGILAERGANFRNTAMMDIKGILLSKKVIENQRESDGRYE